MIVPGGDIGRERSEGVERRLLTGLQLFLHIDLNQMHRHMPRTFDHHLDIMSPRDLRQLAQSLEFRELRLVVRVGNGAGAKSVPEAE